MDRLVSVPENDPPADASPSLPTSRADSPRVVRIVPRCSYEGKENVDIKEAEEGGVDDEEAVVAVFRWPAEGAGDP